MRGEYDLGRDKTENPPPPLKSQQGRVMLVQFSLFVLD